MFWDSQGITMVDHLEEGPIINGAYSRTSMAQTSLEP